MLNTNLSKFKVIYKDKVLRAISLDYLEYDEIRETRVEVIAKPRVISILAINEDGQIVLIRDDAERFQFVPVIS